MRLWSDLQRPLPNWFAESRFGVLVTWGAYSVPAWAELPGPGDRFGPGDRIGPGDRFDAQPGEQIGRTQAEWYANSIRVPGSAAFEYHRAVHGGVPYEAFLDRWHPCEYDPAEWARTFRHAGSDFVVLTAKHHDGIPLWDAPGSGDVNTMRRGPRTDVVKAVAAAVRADDLRLGLSYSAGLDGSIRGVPPITTVESLHRVRRGDPASNFYAYSQVRDLIEKYRPDVLWSAIDWPDAGKRRGPASLHELLQYFYRFSPDGVVNDRWGGTHGDFCVRDVTDTFSRGADPVSGTSADLDLPPCWRLLPLGASYGFNRAEDLTHSMSAADLARTMAEAIADGGGLVLGVGPTASGAIVDHHREILESFGEWYASVRPYARAARPMNTTVSGEPVRARRVAGVGASAIGAEPWSVWWRTPTHDVFVGEAGVRHRVVLPSEGADVSADRVSGLHATTEIRRVDRDARVLEVSGRGVFPVAIVCERVRESLVLA